ncbi:TolC family protein [Gracilimonas sp.]|uniref:TolC family protein n=1 Tax=Gracilimonas sp. TaxID=1974203 RepID=UPI0028722985|nr:TolC family protein [Gracilimonas sp.]
MKTVLLILTTLLCPALIFGQVIDSSLSLNEVYQKVEANYPLTNKKELQRKIAAINDEIARSGLFPEIQLNASARYQSEVTEVPFSAPGSTAPQLSQDHYNISLDLSQPLYDGGLTKARRNLESAQSEVENAGVEVSMWEVQQQAEQVFFGILSLQKRRESIAVLIEDLKEQLSSVQSKIEHGVLLPGNGKVLEAELLKAQQQDVQLKFEIQAAYNVLSELTGHKIEDRVKLEVPNFNATSVERVKISRPELTVFRSQQENLELQQDVIASDRLPKISAIVKGAYGRPGYDVFNDDLHPFWMVGVQAQWSFRSWNNAGKKQEVLELQKKKVQADEEAFLTGVRSELSKSERSIQYLREQLTMDEQVLKLRAEVVAEKKDQLEEGVITSTEYITELNAEAQARINLELRKLQLVQSQIEYATKKGISWN